MFTIPNFSSQFQLNRKVIKTQLWFFGSVHNILREICSIVLVIFTDVEWEDQGVNIMKAKLTWYIKSPII